MYKFEVGNIYACRSVCDHDCIWYFRIVKRTKSTVTFIKDGESEQVTKRIDKKISDMRDSECIYPLGKYSMAPLLSADKSAFKIALN